MARRRIKRVIARDTVPGLMKMYRKLGLSFWHSLGDRLGLDGHPAVATLVSTAARARPPPDSRIGPFCGWRSVCHHTLT